MFDLGSAAYDLSRLVSGVRDDDLLRVTPCADWTVSDLLAHVHVFATVFVANAQKQAPSFPASLVEDWRTAIPARLDELASAWRADSAWQGRVSVGGIEMAAADNAVVAIEELTVHGWDLARATGQELVVDDGRLHEIERFFDLFGSGTESGDGPFGPQATAPKDATLLQLTLARTGRDPLWTPA